MPDKVALREAQVGQAQANLQNTQLKNIELQQDITGAGQDITVPDRTYSIQEQNQDLLIAESFGLYDLAETGIADVGSAIGLAPTGGYESQIAEAAKKQINFDIKATAADAWSFFNGDAKAGARYGVIRNNFASRISELDGQIGNAKAGSAAQANLVKTRANVKHMIDRLDVVQQGFKGTTPQDGSLDIDSFYGVRGINPGVELEVDEAGLDAMQLAYNEFLEE